MNTTKKWAILGTLLLVSGLIICIISYTLFGFNIKDFNTVEYVNNAYEVDGTFKDIKIDADSEKISFVLSKDGKCKVECYENSNAPHEVKNRNNTLSISESTNRVSWNFGFMSEAPKITVYLPEKEYEKLKIDSDTGDVMIPADFSFEEIDIDVDTANVSLMASASGKIQIKTDTGNIDLDDVTAKEMELKSHTGKVEMNDVIIENRLDIQTDTGKVEFSDCDAKDIRIKTDTGKVTGSLLTGKTFNVKSDTGKIDVPTSSGQGTCEIKSDTGSITITIS